MKELGAQYLDLLCGDLYTDPAKRGSSGDALPVWNAFRRYFGMVIGVAGNHDIIVQDGKKTLALTPGVRFFAEPDTTAYAGITLAGIGGVIGRADKPNRMSEPEQVRVLILQNPMKLIPIAWSVSSGNNYLLDYRKNSSSPSVALMDHEEAIAREDAEDESATPEEAQQLMEDNVREVANHFAEFAARLAVAEDSEED
ncbi:MAG: hypothetical protein ACQEXX_29860 [Bacillota bacterium]